MQMHKEFKEALENNLKELNKEIKKTDNDKFLQVVLLQKQEHLV